MAAFVVVCTRSGPRWDSSRPMEEQGGWLAHAAFMDKLVNAGFALLGGPLSDERRVVLVVEAESEDAVRTVLADDPWSGTHLRTASIDPWTIRLDGRRGRPRKGGSQPQPPSGFTAVTPRMVVDDVVAQVEFLRTAFGATGEVEADHPAEVRIGGSVVMVSGSGDRAAFPAFLYLYVDDADATYRRALAAGATSVEVPLDTPYGDRRAMVRDRFGNVFQVAHRRQ